MATILIIDDEMSYLHLYTKAFRQEGFVVLLARSGAEALMRVEKEAPDLVILDMRLPDMDGPELIGQILAEFPTLPIIINTAYHTYKDHFMSWCAAAYVIKSSDLSELKSAVHHAMEKSLVASGQNF